MTRQKRRPAANNRAHAGVDASQTIGAGDHRTRESTSHTDGLVSVSSYALSQPNSIVASSGGHDVPDHAGLQAKTSVASAWSKPLQFGNIQGSWSGDLPTQWVNDQFALQKRFTGAPPPNLKKKDAVTKMPVRQFTQQHLQKMDPAIVQGGCVVHDHAGQQVKTSVASTSSKPSRFMGAPHPSNLKKDAVTKMPIQIHQSTQQRPQKMDSPIFQGGRDLLDHAGQQAKTSVASTSSKPSRFTGAPHPSNLKKDAVTKKPIHQSTQQRPQKMKQPIVQDGRVVHDHAGQQAKTSVASTSSKPSRFMGAPHPSNLKKDAVTKMPIQQSTQQRPQKIGPQIVGGCVVHDHAGQQVKTSVASTSSKPSRFTGAPHPSNLKKNAAMKTPIQIHQSTQQRPQKMDPRIVQGGRDLLDHAGQQAKTPVASAWSKPLRFTEAPHPSNLKKDTVTKMPIRQTTQQPPRRMDQPIAQAKPAPKTSKKTEKKKKKKPFYKEMKKEFRGPTYWKKKAQEDEGLLHRARGIWKNMVGRKAAEYMRRRTAKKLKGKRRVSRKWMMKKEMKKENQNRRAHQKKHSKRRVFIKLNQVYKTKLRVEWRREISEELEKAKREQAILKSADGNESYQTSGAGRFSLYFYVFTLYVSGPKETGESISKAGPSRKEAKKVRKANEKKARRDVCMSRRERVVPKSAGGRHESYPTNGSEETSGKAQKEKKKFCRVNEDVRLMIRDSLFTKSGIKM